MTKRFFLAVAILFLFYNYAFSKGKKEIDPASIVVIDPEIKDKNIKREIEKLISPPKKEFFFDLGFNAAFYQELNFLYQEWKWFESTEATDRIYREEVLDTRIMLNLLSKSGDYIINAGYNFNNFFGAGLNAQAILFPFTERDEYGVIPVFRFELTPYALFGFDAADFFNISLGVGPHLGFYDYKLVADNPNKYNVGLMVVETKIFVLGAALIPQIRFNVSDMFYFGMRLQIIYDPVGFDPAIERRGYLPSPGGTENAYNAYFFGGFMVKGGLYAGLSLRKKPVYRAFDPSTQTGGASGGN
ncbi:MAG: hypothetical protein LBC53_07875 [Spirochaetaceae bacterium]|jgi:hypothetical protein|nr:hypothetical protein [Spirochaetaceae bacterium]